MSKLEHQNHGVVAEWLGSGLQIRLQRFDSARRLFFLHPNFPG